MKIADWEHRFHGRYGRLQKHLKQLSSLMGAGLDAPGDYGRRMTDHRFLQRTWRWSLVIPSWEHGSHRRHGGTLHQPYVYRLVKSEGWRVKSSVRPCGATETPETVIFTDGVLVGGASPNGPLWVVSPVRPIDNAAMPANVTLQGHEIISLTAKSTIIAGIPA